MSAIRPLLIAAGLVLSPVLLPSQHPSPFVGAWRLVSYVQPDSLGRVRPVWGDRPFGLIIYHADQTMAAQGFDDRRPSLQANNDAAARAAAFTGLFAYYGRYDVDSASRQVTHHVEGAWITDWIGHGVVRSYRFLDSDHLELRVVSNADGRKILNGGTLVWERVK